jgi:hypothetical protein
MLAEISFIKHVIAGITSPHFSRSSDVYIIGLLQDLLIYNYGYSNFTLVSLN